MKAKILKSFRIYLATFIVYVFGMAILLLYSFVIELQNGNESGMFVFGAFVLLFLFLWIPLVAGLTLQVSYLLFSYFRMRVLRANPNATPLLAYILSTLPFIIVFTFIGVANYQSYRLTSQIEHESALFDQATITVKEALVDVVNKEPKISLILTSDSAESIKGLRVSIFLFYKDDRDHNSYITQGSFKEYELKEGDNVLILEGENRQKPMLCSEVTGNQLWINYHIISRKGGFGRDINEYIPVTNVTLADFCE